MLKRLFLLLTAYLFSLSFSYAQVIDSGLSKVDFEISNFRVNTVEGFFNGMTGEIQFDENNLSESKFNVCISSSTVNTDNEKRDTHLKNEDFFEIEKYPEICFVSNEIKKNGDKYITVGQLTMHGVTKEVKITFTKNGNTFNGDLKIKRLDFDVGKDTGTFTVGNEVSLHIKCVLN
ncbi:YceI family protein [Flammeovirga sp. MY04]|uniref:YceI family protein n=1 Tax=Flammeovirga sp. MY04 TaxID=1191459 RepID=UPI0008060FAA|nr:YceI family protein [Flammeovirga sp. MY04]ANQ48260.1 YceI family protein [Flammeovirga sp. MY04]